MQPVSFDMSPFGLVIASAILLSAGATLETSNGTESKSIRDGKGHWRNLLIAV
jgi:hypothetical protein